jgi:ATP-dependent protease ClpP protease subunit
MSESQGNETENVVIIDDKKNYIYYNGPIESKHVNYLISQLHFLEEELQKVDDIEYKLKKHDRTILFERDKYVKPIKIFLTSYGGYIFQAFLVADVIQNLKIPVHTICQGFVASAATIISLAGKKRFITKMDICLFMNCATNIREHFLFYTFEHLKRLLLLKFNLDYF